jgi:hypothetical protein
MNRSGVHWKEVISRGAAIALMQNFSSVAAALKELVDNAINYRWGQTLEIDIRFDRKSDILVVSSDGGRGMDDEGIQFWLNWGDGEQHKQEELSRWHQGGKAACGFLGSHVRIWAKAQNSSDVWFLEDEDWAGRREPRDFGQAVPLSIDTMPVEKVHPSFERGHVRIELRKLVRDRRWNLDDLRQQIANTYRKLLEEGMLTIRIDGEDVKPLEIPISSSISPIKISTKGARGYRVEGWAGRLQREKLTRSLKSGMRLLHSYTVGA